MAGKRHGAVFVCAHGAGGNKDDAGMRRLAKALEPHGFEVARFNFPYVEQGASRPDPMPVLRRAFERMVERVHEEVGLHRLVIGGRSMGGRVASMLAADGFACDGLLLAAYPLHPSGKPEKLRDAHLAKINCPVLCFNGTRDKLCERELMERAVSGLPHWKMHWLEGADHSFRVLKSSGRSEAEIDAEVGAAAARWLAELGR